MILNIKIRNNLKPTTAEEKRIHLDFLIDNFYCVIDGECELLLI